MKFTCVKSSWIGVVALLPLLSTTALAQADFDGQTIEMIVPFSAGGGADGYGRYMAAGLSENLAGNPTVLVQNMPGGGSVVGMNAFEAHGDKEGLSLALSSTSTTLTVAIRPEDPAVQFDASQWHAFLTQPLGRVVYVRADTGITNIADLKANLDQEFVIGLESPTGSDMPNVVTLKLLGLNLRAIFGFDGGDEQLAFERGELNINGDPMTGYLPTRDNPLKIPLFTYGILDESGNMVRDPNLPDLPTFFEVYREIHGEDLSGPEYDAWMALFNIAVMGSKALVLPADTDPEAIAAYDAAAAAMVADTEFVKNGEAIYGNYLPVAGEQAEAIFSSSTQMDPAAREWLINFLNTELDAGL